ncbi:MAG: two-component regulator propeller domain-containing protein [Nocardioidaceae bacterium]
MTEPTARAHPEDSGPHEGDRRRRTAPCLRAAAPAGTRQPRRKGRLLFWLGASFLFTSAAPSVLADPVRPIRFDRLGLEQGLSQSTVMRILQDSRGYVWLGTEDGLNRYDGIAVKVYRHAPSDERSLPASFVWDVDEDMTGDLWVATTAGLARWHRTTDTMSRQDSLADQHIRSLRYSAAGNLLWIGTRDAGLFRLEVATGKLTRFSHDPARLSSLIDDRIYALTLDREGRLWVGTDGGLDRLDPGAEGFVHFRSDPSKPRSLSDPRVRAILEDAAGTLWVGTTVGLNRWDSTDGGFRRYRHEPSSPTSLASDTVRAVLQDADGRLWVGTYQGLDLVDAAKGTFTHYRKTPNDPGGLADDHVLSLAQDRGGVLWVGTRLGGAHKWNPLSWQFGHVAPDPGNPKALGSGNVTSFSVDAAGRLWIGTFDAGLYAMDRFSGEMTAYRHDPRDPRSIASDKVMALHHDRRGHLWVGTLDSGLDRFSATSASFTHFPSDPARPEGLSAAGVTSILEDRRGRLWLGTYGGGLEMLDPETQRFTHHRFDPKDPASLNGDRVSSLAEAADGRLWVGTMEKGLARLDPHTRRFERFVHGPTDPGSLPSNSIKTVFIDVSGGLWIGTHSGLSHLAPGVRTFRTYTTKDGLSNDVVYGVRADQRGRLWLSTNNGLSCLDPQTGGVRTYGISDGLQATEFNFGAWFQSATGELFFGGIGGFNAFRPEGLRHVTSPPALVLTSVAVGHRPLPEPPDQVQAVHLGFRDKVLAFDFAALDFTAPHRNRFAYKLEGFDPDWVPLKGRQGVTYTNLNSGQYTFRLRGANSDGLWNDEGLTVRVDVAAAPWATRWALTAYGLLLVGSILALVRFQQRKFAREAEYARVLETRVQERTRELSERQMELERVNEELAQVSVTDALTGLANRRFFIEYVEREVALLHRRYDRKDDGQAQARLIDLAFVMIDVDNFKLVNDSAGHAAGDAVLRQLRDLLKAVCRSSDVIVRWGGDEFLLVARDLTSHSVAELCERVRARVAAHAFDVGEGRVMRTTCSVGFAGYPFFRERLDALTWGQVLSVADRALYIAKASGRNRWVGFDQGSLSGPVEGLFGAICRDIEKVVQDGILHVSSAPDDTRPLVWEPPSANGVIDG